ncbi:MAG TPA: YceH family protein [Thermoleophilaceae bacterium]|jgi:hypothetical protein
MEPSPVEIRVLGALIEKQRTTPDQYPLTLNSLRLACNQSTNRDPVVDYDEAAIKDALQRLRQRGWTRYAAGHGGRTAKYRHLLNEALGLAPDEMAVLCVMMLRGPQTPGELKQRTERLHPFGSLADVEETVGRLIDRELAARVRRPGQKEDRFAQLLGGTGEGDAEPHPWPVEPAVAADPDEEERTTGLVAEARPVAAVPDPPGDGLDVLSDRVSALERTVVELREEIAELRRELGG